MKTEFTVLGKAKPKARPRCAKRGRKVFAYTPPDTLEYERHVAASAVFPEGWPLDSDYVVSLEVFHENNVYGDLDNIAKSVLDGLNNHGGAWNDDKQVSQLLMARRFDAEHPRIEVRIRAIPPEKSTKPVRAKASRATSGACPSLPVEPQENLTSPSPQRAPRKRRSTTPSSSDRPKGRASKSKSSSRSK
jgi:Holliday junction resolvase RusA-like endonuclease